MFKKLPTYLFIFGCSGSLLLRAHFSSCSELGLRSSCRVWASHRSGFPCCGACALGHRFSSCVAYALKHVGPSWTRDGTYVPCTGRQILKHWTTMEVWHFLFKNKLITFRIPDDDCSDEIKRCLLLGRKAMTNLDNILRSRDITLPTKVHLVKAMVFPVVMYGCENWTMKKAEHRRIDAFELWWGRLLRVSWTARRSN